MSLLYRIYKNTNKSSSGYNKYYARAKQIGVIETDAIAEIVQRNCTVKKSDVKAVIEELVEVIQDKLQESYSVKLNGLGTFRLTISSKPANEVKEFSASKNIRRVSCRFAPERRRDTNGVTTRALCTGTRLAEYDEREKAENAAQEGA